MKKFLITLAVTFGILFTMAQPAQASSRGHVGCVTSTEYRKIDYGYSIPRVRHTFGARGVHTKTSSETVTRWVYEVLTKQLWSYTVTRQVVTYEYNKCGSWGKGSKVVVRFDQWWTSDNAPFPVQPGSTKPALWSHRQVH